MKKEENHVPLVDLPTKVYNKHVTDITKYITTFTGSTNESFTKVCVIYYLGLMAASMRAQLVTKDQGNLDINVYAMNFGDSGIGKGYAVTLMKRLMKGFFAGLKQQMATRSAANIESLALEISVLKGTEPDVESEQLRKQYEDAGEFLNEFDSGTTAGMRQLKTMLTIAGVGSLNLVTDEIGDTLGDLTELMPAFLIGYDSAGGASKKLILNTKDRPRGSTAESDVVSTMMLFGTPQTVFDGGVTENNLISLLQTGYARRSFIGYSESGEVVVEASKDVYDKRVSTEVLEFVSKTSKQFTDLADAANMKIAVPKEISLMCIDYQTLNKVRTSKLPMHSTLQRTELQHRHYKMLKLAGVFAFIDGRSELSIRDVKESITYTEEFGETFVEKIVNRQRDYERLAHYLADTPFPVNQADMIQQLPYYSQASPGARNTLVQLAAAYGVQANISISTTERSGVAFFEGKALVPTDMNKIIVSHGENLGEGYSSTTLPFNNVANLVKHPNTHWVNHALHEGNRNSDSVIPGFNVVVFDIDHGVHIKTAMAILKEYTYMLHTTKRHSSETNRFRIIMPLSHTLRMDKETYKAFMQNLYLWLPFEVDTATGQRCRKWLCNSSHVTINNNTSTKLLGVEEFIPNTARERETNKNTNPNIPSMRRWFMREAVEGNRNNLLFRYAKMCAKSKPTTDELYKEVMSLNQKLTNSLTATEVRALVTSALTIK